MGALGGAGGVWPGEREMASGAGVEEPLGKSLKSGSYQGRGGLSAGAVGTAVQVKDQLLLPMPSTYRTSL